MHTAAAEKHHIDIDIALALKSRSLHEFQVSSYIHPSNTGWTLCYWHLHCHWARHEPIVLSWSTSQWPGNSYLSDITNFDISCLASLPIHHISIRSQFYIELCVNVPFICEYSIIIPWGPADIEPRVIIPFHRRALKVTLENFFSKAKQSSNPNFIEIQYFNEDYYIGKLRASFAALDESLSVNRVWGGPVPMRRDIWTKFLLQIWIVT